jgi:hypothetical protein
MRLSVVLLAALAAFSAPAWGQKKPRPPKKEKKGHYTILLPVVNLTGITGEEADFQSLYARAGLLKVFSERRFDILSPAEMQVTAEQNRLDLKTPSVWTSENLDKLADPWGAPYVAGIELLSVQDQEEPAPLNKKKAMANVNAHVKVAAWLYETKTHKFLMENTPSEVTYSAKKTTDKVDNKGINYTAVMNAVQNAFKDFLSKFHKAPPPEKKH